VDFLPFCNCECSRHAVALGINQTHGGTIGVWNWHDRIKRNLHLRSVHNMRYTPVGRCSSWTTATDLAAQAQASAVLQLLRVSDIRRPLQKARRRLARLGSRSSYSLKPAKVCRNDALKGMAGTRNSNETPHMSPPSATWGNVRSRAVPAVAFWVD
jgi:hypothetical protein